MRITNKALWIILIKLPIALLVFTGASFSEFTAAFWGDSRSNSGNAMSEICGYLVAERGKSVDVHWQNGDFTQHGSMGDWNDSWSRENVREACVKDYFFMCTSNHEFHQDDGTNYKANLGDILPSNGKNIYYSMTSWDIPGSQRKVHLLMFDLYRSGEQEQLDYFTPRLEAVSPNDWIAAMWHNPTFSGMTYKGSHGRAQNFTRLIETASNGGDFVLNGHAHQYRRSHVLDWQARVLETTGGPGTTHISPDDSWGMVHIVNGRGGQFDGSDKGSGWSGNAFAPTLRSAEGLVTLMIFDDNTMTMRTIVIGDDNREEEELESWIWVRGEPMPDSGTSTNDASILGRNRAILDAIPAVLDNKLEFGAYVDVKAIAVYDTKGKQMYYKKYQTAQNSVDIGKFNQGYYLVKFVLDEGVITKPMMKYDF